MASLGQASESKAEQFILQGERELKRFSLFSSTAKWENACECFKKAGNSYKVAKKWQEAGDVFMRCADLQVKLQQNHEAATFYVEAAQAYKKVNPTEAIDVFRQAIDLYTDVGRFGPAAKLSKEIAELYEASGEIEEALEAYRTSSDLYLGDNSQSASNQCLLKVAKYSAELERYEPSIEILEQVAVGMLDSNLLRFNAKGLFLQALLCTLASGDTVAARQNLDRYKELDFSFGGSRECAFIEDLVTHCENFDVDAFTDAVYNFDNVSKLDAWKTTILLRVKNSIAGVGGDGDDVPVGVPVAGGEEDEPDLT